MTFTQAREDYFSSNQVDYSVEIQRDIYEELSTHFEELDLDFLQEIVEIQRDILDEAGKYKGTYLEDFDFVRIFMEPKERRTNGPKKIFFCKTAAIFLSFSFIFKSVAIVAPPVTVNSLSTTSKRFTALKLSVVSSPLPATRSTGSPA